MFTAKRNLPFLIVALIGLYSADCEKKPKTESDFLHEEILSTGMGTRVNGLEDLLYFSAQQASNACQQDCDKLKEAVSAAEKSVATMEDLLFQRTGGIQPPPPPCPCQFGNCLWERFAVFSYFVDLKKYSKLPNVSVETLNGAVISSSEKAEVLYSPEGGQFAIVNLPKQEFQDKTVKMVITSGDGTAEVLVNIK